MNLSGQAVGEAMRFYKLTPADVTCSTTRLDLAPGKVRQDRRRRGRPQRHPLA
jgi:PTH1 family peptidyl-tRNA hydrolase